MVKLFLILTMNRWTKKNDKEMTIDQQKQTNG